MSDHESDEGSGSDVDSPSRRTRKAPPMKKEQLSDGASLTVGAQPTATFPCNHLARPQSAAVKDESNTGGATWSLKGVESPSTQLMAAVRDEDWAGLFAEGKMKFQVQAAWSASKERCETLCCLCSMAGATRVLEIGAFCGVATLAVADVLPSNGEIISLELDQFLVDYGAEIRRKSESKQKITTMVGPAMESLEDLAKRAKAGDIQPFDLIVIDADKDSMRSYFDFVWNEGALLNARGTVCIDVTPFKGQPPARFVRFGQADKWEVKSGQEVIDKMRAGFRSSDLKFHEFGGLLVLQKR